MNHRRRPRRWGMMPPAWRRIGLGIGALLLFAPVLWAASPAATPADSTWVRPGLLKGQLLVANTRIQQLEDDLATSREQISRLIEVLDLLVSDLRRAPGKRPTKRSVAPETKSLPAEPTTFLDLGEWIRVEGPLTAMRPTLVETSLFCDGQPLDEVIESVERADPSATERHVTWLPSVPCSGELSVTRHLFSE